MRIEILIDEHTDASVVFLGRREESCSSAEIAGLPGASAERQRMHVVRDCDRPLLPYERLLVDCVTSFVSGRPAQLHSELDWPSLVVQSVRHGVAQPVAAVLLDRDSALDPPPDVAVVLERLIEANRDRNVTAYTELARLLDCFVAEGVDALALKGVALSQTVYPDFALRNFADIDILVRERDMDHTHDLALRDGWRLQEEREPGHHHAVYTKSVERDILTDTVTPEYDPELTPGRLAPFAKTLRLEIHRTPFYDVSGAGTDADLSDFWMGAETATFPQGGRFSLLSPEAMLVHLCAHASTHAYGKLQFVLDVALLLQKSKPLDPALVTSLADRYHARGQVSRLLAFLATNVDGVNVESLLDRLGPLKGAPLTWQEILDGPGRNKIETRMRHWSRAGSPGEKLRGAFRMVVPTPVAMRRIYGKCHPAMLPALYILRPFQLTGRLLLYLVGRRSTPLQHRGKEYRCSGLR